MIDVTERYGGVHTETPMLAEEEVIALAGEDRFARLLRKGNLSPCVQVKGYEGRPLYEATYTLFRIEEDLSLRKGAPGEGVRVREATGAVRKALYGRNRARGVSEEVAWYCAGGTCYPVRQARAGVVVKGHGRQEGSVARPLTPAVRAEYERLRKAFGAYLDRRQGRPLSPAVQREYRALADRFRQVFGLAV
jgi:hypothetical protein